MSGSWVGLVLLATVTSLPELATGISAVTAFTAAMMSGAVILGLIYRPRQRVLGTMSVVSAALLAAYLVSVYVLSNHVE